MIPTAFRTGDRGSRQARRRPDARLPFSSARTSPCRSPRRARFSALRRARSELAHLYDALQAPQLPTAAPAADIPDSRDTIVRSFLHRYSDRHRLGTLAHQTARQRALLNWLQSAAGSEKAPASCTAYTARRRRSITCRRILLSTSSRWSIVPAIVGISRAARGIKRPRRAIWRNRRWHSALSRCRWRWGFRPRRPGVPRDLLGSNRPGRF